MGNVRRIYVEKKAPFAVKAKELESDLKNYLNLKTIEGVRIFIRYDVEHISDEVFEKACRTVFSEPPVDDLYEEELPAPEGARVFSVEYLPGIRPDQGILHQPGGFQGNGSGKAADVGDRI